MSELGVIDQKRDLSVDTGNRLFSYIDLVNRHNSSKHKSKANSQKKKK